MRQLDLFNTPDTKNAQKEAPLDPTQIADAASPEVRTTDEPAEISVLLNDDHMIYKKADLNIDPETIYTTPANEQTILNHEVATGFDDISGVTEPVTIEVDRQPATTPAIENEPVDTIVFEDGKISVKIKGKLRAQVVKAKEETTPEHLVDPIENRLAAPVELKVEGNNKINQLKFSDAFKQEYSNSVEDKLSRAKWSIQESLQKDNQKKTVEKDGKDDKDKTPQKRGRKSFKEMDAEADLTEVPDDEILFSKRYYPISIVAGWFRVNTSLLRFWENEFDILKPKKNGKGDRLFRPEDVKNLQLIHHLLRQKKFTLDGAKDFLKTNKDTAGTQFQLTQTLQNFKRFLLELKANLQS